MSKAPLVHLEGKLGKFGHARTFKVDGLGHLTKSKGRFVLHAAITASQAARLDEASKKVSAEEEARLTVQENEKRASGRTSESSA